MSEGSHPEGNDHPRCARCHEVIGVYEPIRVILRDGSAVAGSRLTLGVELGDPDTITTHEQCWETDL